MNATTRDAARTRYPPLREPPPPTLVPLPLPSRSRTLSLEASPRRGRRPPAPPSLAISGTSDAALRGPSSPWRAPSPTARSALRRDPPPPRTRARRRRRGGGAPPARRPPPRPRARGARVSWRTMAFSSETFRPCRRGASRPRSSSRAPRLIPARRRSRSSSRGRRPPWNARAWGRPGPADAGRARRGRARRRGALLERRRRQKADGGFPGGGVRADFAPLRRHHAARGTPPAPPLDSRRRRRRPRARGPRRRRPSVLRGPPRDVDVFRGRGSRRGVAHVHEHLLLPPLDGHLARAFALGVPRLRVRFRGRRERLGGDPEDPERRRARVRKPRGVARVRAAEVDDVELGGRASPSRTSPPPSRPGRSRACRGTRAWRLAAARRRGSSRRRRRAPRSRRGPRARRPSLRSASPPAGNSSPGRTPSRARRTRAGCWPTRRWRIGSPAP